MPKMTVMTLLPRSEPCGINVTEATTSSTGKKCAREANENVNFAYSLEFFIAW